MVNDVTNILTFFGDQIEFEDFLVELTIELNVEYVFIKNQHKAT